VMAISVISVSSDSSEDNYTPASPDYSPVSDMEFDPSENPSSDHIPPLPAISPFLSSANDTTDNDTPDTPSSPTHGIPFTETTLSTQRSPTSSGALRRKVMVLAPGQPIPHGRPYRYHLNGPVHMMTARKWVGPLPTHRLAVRHSVDYSSSDHFSLDDSWYISLVVLSPLPAKFTPTLFPFLLHFVYTPHTLSHQLPPWQSLAFLFVKD
ncbi:hypothetical protein Tco_1208430, partial [Tanacetum coccineum]